MRMFLGGLALGLACLAAVAFTKEQASSGNLIYIGHCSMCHGPEGKGGRVPPNFKGLEYLKAPALVGKGSVIPGFGTAGRLLAYIGANMPAQAPGSLKQKQYLEVTAHLLQANGIRPDGKPLTPQNAGQIFLNVRERL